MACCALKVNLTACRNHASNGSKYCYQHQDHNTEIYKQRWLNKHVYCPDGNVFSFYDPYRIKSILSDLKSGKVVLTAKDIEAIPVRSDYIDIYLLLLMNGYAKTEHNPKLTVRTLHYYLRMKLYVPPEAQARLETLKIIRNYLIEDTARNFFVFLWTLPSISKRVQEINRILVEEVQSLLNSTGAKELSWYSRETLNKLFLHYKQELGADHILTQYMVQRWLLDLKELYTTEKNIQRCKMDHCKEELMMNRWHPSRIEHYHELGLDIDDM